MKAIEAFGISKLGINTNLIPKIMECAYEGKTELNATTQLGYDAGGYELTYKDINWLDQNGYEIEHRVVDLGR